MTLEKHTLKKIQGDNNMTGQMKFNQDALDAMKLMDESIRRLNKRIQELELRAKANQYYDQKKSNN